MSQTDRPYYTPEQYFTSEEYSLEKHEYYRGEIYLMAGGSVEHNQIATNIVISMGQSIRGKGCRIYTSDLRLGVVSPESFYTYPDVFLVCEKLQRLAGRNDVVLNPILIIEVLSPSTAKYDRTTKFELYKGLPSFKHYLLVEQDRVGVTYHFKTEAGMWKSRTYTSLDGIIKLFDFEDVELPIADFYDGIEFAE